MTNSKKYIIGNWKMFKDRTSAVRDFSLLVELLGKNQGQQKNFVAIAAPSVFLSVLSEKTKSFVEVFSQNAHWEQEGAFTGEISVAMLKSISVSGSLVGHSERRQFFGETDQTAGKRVGALLRAKMKAVLCIGESLAERESGQLEQILRKQLLSAIEATGLGEEREFLGDTPENPLFLIAYEPVWAIGTGKSATEQEAEQAHGLIRTILAERFGKTFASCVPILYGGSVKLENIETFLACPNVNGALIGGASLDPNLFAQMCIK